MTSSILTFTLRASKSSASCSSCAGPCPLGLGKSDAVTARSAPSQHHDRVRLPAWSTLPGAGGSSPAGDKWTRRRAVRAMLGGRVTCVVVKRGVKEDVLAAGGDAGAAPHTPRPRGRRAALRTLRIGGAVMVIVSLLALVTTPSSAPLLAASASAHVLAPITYKPTGRWCPTNRTCFSHVTWQVYSSTRAVGFGPAKSCPGGGVGACHSVAKVVVELTRPRRECHAERFTRLRMFANTFRLSPVICTVYQ
jgi:hypothetical protein